MLFWASVFPLPERNIGDLGMGGFSLRFVAHVVLRGGRAVTSEATICLQTSSSQQRDCETIQQIHEVQLSAGQLNAGVPHL